MEMEPFYEKGNMEGNDFEWISSFFSRIKSTDNRVEASQIAAEQVKEMLGYDRFDEQWNGNVIAEAREVELEPFLGHHYPASDIPKQARELYLRNWLRTIVNVNYTPVEIVCRFRRYLNPNFRMIGMNVCRRNSVWDCLL
ncbi:hypothetical protein ACFVQB_04175 [Paenibacillus sp. NPDC057886]|uniref:hypothetical protein n=1 Tax=Paenibacillus sp. NPDC057886 TaxID=3346270 RepID=UPI00367A2833